MSVKVMSYVWDIPLFKGSDKLVMLCLADHADDSGLCWPSIDTIARKSGVSPTTVKSTLKKLEAGGWIAKKNQFKTAETGRLVRANNQYQLPVLLLKKKADEQTDFEQSNFVHSKLERSKLEQTKEAQGVGQISPGGRSDSGYKPSLDPSIDPPREDLVPSELETAKPADPIVFEIPLRGKSALHAVTQSQLFEYRELYPAVDVVQQIRNMIGWCKANPTRQKTASGIQRFIHSWLCKEQDKSYSPISKPTAISDERDELKRNVRQLEIDINNENSALLSFQQRRSPASDDAAKSCLRKINEMLSQRESLLLELGRLNGE
ncbi:TPA: helix-turn-helix domain-containing protein [Vibrio vulnificus]|nr:helix-turn-helix domain-containing protein [Vibrio vulnificus]HAS6036110.1 helix-turn-helix domain-containing protein [Vibrio vulnificus]HAS6354458.1 helix-turn-helix domain-containing protein [Vibrio vulnificus]HAS6368364.1 helix-turn-helix domain-containing protein [Vibrio vulnificus]HDY7612167.1 helix-turn-helix domain-containing protein [Vibrio vulnificus]